MGTSITEHFYLNASADGLKLGCLAFLPKGRERKPEGVVQLVHGMCEHKERYIPFMEFLNENGWACVIHDHRGHGESVKSEEDLGYFYEGGHSAMVEDIKVVNDWIRNKFPGQKLVLLGHSMGSMAVRAFVKKYDCQIDSLIVCGSPSDNPAKGLGIAVCKMIAFFKGWHCRPAIMQKLSLDGYQKGLEAEGPNAWICKDKEVRDLYNKDRLCTFRFTCNGFRNLLELMKVCYAPEGWTMRRPELPIWFISGAEDPCRTDDKQFGQAVEAMRKVGYRNVTETTYQNMRHEILNEIDKENVWNNILTFIKK